MTIAIGSNQRRLIPRWRAPNVSSQAGEWNTLQPGPPQELNDAHFLAALAEFEKDHSVESALEVVGGAIVLSEEPRAKAAALFLAEQETAARGSRELAREVLRPILPSIAAWDSKGSQVRPEYLAISRIRASLRAYPANPLLWMELARAYLFLGQRRPAQMATKIAVDLAPTNRYVLRAATRFFIHDHDPERALYLLDRGNPSLRDPWLLAARIATAQVADQPPQFIKQGLQLLASASLAPLQTSELAGALGSLELFKGNQRFARRHFKQSLIDPTENAVAQAVWTQKDLREFKVPPETLLRQDTFEANACQAFRDGRWKASLEACLGWLADEPFSSRPITLGSFLAIEVMEDFQLCESLCEKGLESNPHHPGLINNLTVALVYKGDLERAEEKLSMVAADQSDQSMHAHLIATKGLLAFRRGRVEEGRNFYNRAIDLAASDPVVKAMAVIHLGLEEVRHDARIGEEVAMRAEVESKGIKDESIRLLIGRLNARVLMAKETQAPKE